MKPRSIIVDMAAEQGGDCALTEPGKVVVKHNVTITGYTDLPSRLAKQSSQLYASNLRHLLDDLTPEKNGIININMEDEVIRGTTVVKEGNITWPPPAPAAPPPAPAVVAVAPVEKKPKKEMTKWLQIALTMGAGALILAGLGSVAPPAFMSHFTVFVLACFVGYQVIWNVTSALHTPLMSVTNAISSIIVIGALLQISSPGMLLTVLSGVAVLITTINISG